MEINKELLKEDLQKNKTKNMKELFKAQLTDNQPVTEENLKKINPHYFNGEKIKVGDKYLVAFVFDGSIDNLLTMGIKMVIINETHIDLYEQDTEYGVSKFIPIIKLKKQ